MDIELTTETLKNDHYKLMYVEFTQNLTGPIVVQIEGILKSSKDNLTNELVLDIIDRLSEQNDPGIFTLNKEDLTSRKLATRILHASNFIAVEGRIGSATNALIPSDLYEELNLDDLDMGDIKLSKYNGDSIYVYRKNKIDMPGLVLLEKDNKYDLIKVGSNAHKQFVKIKIN